MLFKFNISCNWNFIPEGKIVFVVKILFMLSRTEDICLLRLEFNIGRTCSGHSLCHRLWLYIGLVSGEPVNHRKYNHFMIYSFSLLNQFPL